jgi:hypothetical protein
MPICQKIKRNLHSKFELFLSLCCAQMIAVPEAVDDSSDSSDEQFWLDCDEAAADFAEGGARLDGFVVPRHVPMNGGKPRFRSDNYDHRYWDVSRTGRGQPFYQIIDIENQRQYVIPEARMNKALQ